MLSRSSGAGTRCTSLLRPVLHSSAPGSSNEGERRMRPQRGAFGEGGKKGGRDKGLGVR